MMQLLVLGYVPGTSIQIDFNFFATISALIALVYLVRLLFKEEKLIKQQLIEFINSRAI